MTTISSKAFQLKGSMMTLTVLHLMNPDPKAINQQLNKIISETPNLFRNMPVVIDLQQLATHSGGISFQDITSLLREYGLIPVGVCNGNDAQQQAAQLSGLGTLSGASSSTSKSIKRTPQKTPEPIRPLVISQPVRSGQQIYAKGTDLIIKASVSNGAEIIADGHIHVYGTLRGRALAGVNGDQSAHIFTLKLHAELVSIAGHYKLHDKLDTYNLDGPVSITLEDEQLHMQTCLV